MSLILGPLCQIKMPTDLRLLILYGHHYGIMFDDSRRTGFDSGDIDIDGNRAIVLVNPLWVTSCQHVLYMIVEAQVCVHSLRWESGKHSDFNMELGTSFQFMDVRGLDQICGMDM